jgi:hypothetical protein
MFSDKPLIKKAMMDIIAPKSTGRQHFSVSSRSQFCHT